MDILQVFQAYTNDILAKMREADYFQCVKYRDEYQGVYRFIKNFVLDWRGKQQITEIFTNDYPLIDGIVKSKDI